MDRKGKVPFLNGAAMIFEANNSFISECIMKFTDMYNPKRFGTVGPELLWKTYQFINASDSNSPILPHILESKVFYPIRFRSHTLKAFFAKIAPINQLPWFDESTIGVHFWGHLSTRFDILKESKGGSILENCDDIKFLKSLTQRKKENGEGNVNIRDGMDTRQGDKVHADSNTGNSSKRKKRQRKNKDSSTMISNNVIQELDTHGEQQKGVDTSVTTPALVSTASTSSTRTSSDNIKYKIEESAVNADRNTNIKKGISSVSAGGLKGKKFKSGANGWFP